MRDDLKRIRGYEGLIILLRLSVLDADLYYWKTIYFTWLCKYCNNRLSAWNWSKSLVVFRTGRLGILQSSKTFWSCMLSVRTTKYQSYIEGASVYVKPFGYK